MSERSAVHYRTMRSPTGEFFVALRAIDGRLIETGWTAHRADPPDSWRVVRTLAPTLVDRLVDALAGRAADFSDVLIPDCSPFFARCRAVVRQLPVGTTITYGELARRAGSAAAVRAAGQSMRRNPTPVVVPCHRVTAANGVGGFAGAWGKPGTPCPLVALKVALLDLEQHPRRPARSA